MDPTITEHVLRSTPQSDPATISEHTPTVGSHVSDIPPWIAKDVENFQGCPIDKMLKDFLVDATGKPQDSFEPKHRTRLFEKCLKNVLPICSGEAQVNNENDINSSMVKEYIVQYSEAHGEHENELYSSFVTVANVALQHLQELEIADLRPFKNDNSSICFHVDDPPTLRQLQGNLSEPKPDVAVVSRSDAYDPDTSEQQILCWRDVLFTILTRAPKKPLGWRNVRTFVQFERSTKNIAVPPDRYTLKEITPRQEVDVLNDEAEPDVSRARHPLYKPVRRSADQQEKTWDTNSDSRKRTSEHLDPHEFQSKRQKLEHTASLPVIVQAGYYAAEMFAAFAAREQVIGLVIVGDILYVRRYDRQGTIQCSGLNFIEDLPRFLVLLLAMQRFEAKHWGLNPHVDPTFGPWPPFHTTTLCDDDEGNEIQVKFWLSDKAQVTYFGLNGWGTNMLRVECKELSEDSDIVAKTSWMDLARMSEPEILKKAYEIAKTDPDVNGHLPEMLWFKIFHDNSTAKIRGRLDIDTTGARVLCIIIFRKLNPITELQGKGFLNAWWHTVKCHYALWKRGIHHRDISPSNLMYHRGEQDQIVAVLNDFDKASILAIATGTPCTGTAPFMAMQLLGKVGVQGNIPHVYEHDAESFIWVLVWISLRYTNGKLKGDHDRPLDEWLSVDPTECREKKADFLANLDMRERLQAGEGHEQNWSMAEDCIIVLMKRVVERTKAMIAQKEDHLDIDTVFQRLLHDPTSHYLE